MQIFEKPGESGHSPHQIVFGPDRKISNLHYAPSRFCEDAPQVFLTLTSFFWFSSLFFGTHQFFFGTAQFSGTRLFFVASHFLLLLTFLVLISLFATISFF